MLLTAPCSPNIVRMWSIYHWPGQGKHGPEVQKPRTTAGRCSCGGCDDLIAIRISWRPADRTEVGWLTNQLSALIDINRPSCTNLLSQRFFFSIASFDFWKIPCFPFSLYIFIFNRSNTMKFVFYFLFIIIVALQTMPRLSYDWNYRVSFFVVSHEIFLDNKKKRKEGDDLSRVLCTFLTWWRNC